MSSPDQIWRKSVTPEWLHANEARLLEIAGGSLAIIERAGRKRVLLESCEQVAPLRQKFGGKIEELRAWSPPPLKPIRIGKRLVICDAVRGEANELVIPAGAAFGTGEHATTAMSLRMLERATRGLTSSWRMLDAGTGSGILALAGKRFGAESVLALDNDPMAVSTAKANAQRNRIKGVKFTVGDVRKITGRYEVITANLYSELLISILPRLRRTERLILSGVMRSQERRVSRALRANGFRIQEIRRRGKWIAVGATAVKILLVSASTREKRG